MNPKFSKKDVVLYFADKLDRARRREIEMACKTDAQIRRWFAELTPTDVELEHEPAALVAAETPKYRQIAARTYESVEGDDEVATVARLFDPTPEAMDLTECGSVIPAEELFRSKGGRMALCARIPRTIAGDVRPPAITPVEIPCIQPDFVNDRLTIRQWATDDLASGMISVFAAKIIAPGQVERFGPARVEMTKGKRKDGTAYWHKEISIRSLAPNLGPDDEVVFYVEPSHTSDEAE
jgi:hypothetical protein